jgi:hypothetical protein
LRKEFEKELKIGFETIFDNHHLLVQIAVALESIETKSSGKLLKQIRTWKHRNWSFKLNATNTSREAEILASMYDSS